MQPSTLAIADTLGDLVRINSVNPLQAGARSGPGGEQTLAEEIAARSADLGAAVELDEILPGRSNVYASFAGSSDHTVAIDVHLDTVGVEHMTDDPFDGRIEGGRVFGRGSVDTKATFAVVLQVLAELRETASSPVPTVLLVGTISEEIGGLLGAAGFARWLRRSGRVVDQLVIAEPTLCAPVHGHKGALGLEVTVHGVAAHSSTPELGVNAISAAARLVAAIDEEQQRLVAAGGTTPVGPGTIGVNEIHGGAARNIVPPTCELYIGRRLAPGEDPATVEEGLRRIVAAAAQPAEVSITLAYGRATRAFYAEPDTPLARRLAALAGTAPTTATYGSNALAYGPALHDGSIGEAVLFGPGSIDQAHKASEWVALTELERAHAVYRRWLTTVG